jgi:hypothetical protein
MPRDDEVRFFVDETSLPLGQALARLRGDVVHPGHRRLPEIPPGTLDTDWLPIIGKRGLVVIGRDRHIVTKPAELEEYKRHNIKAFWIAGDKDLGSWENLRRVARWWDQIEQLIDRRGDGPWFYGIWPTTVSELKVRDPRQPKPDTVVRRRPPIIEKSGQLRISWKRPKDDEPGEET